MSEMKRKAVLLSVYYTGEEPVFANEDNLFLNNAALRVLKTANINSEIFDVAVDRTPERLFSFSSPFARFVYKAFRRWR